MIYHHVVKNTTNISNFLVLLNNCLQCLCCYSESYTDSKHLLPVCEYVR